MDRLGCQIEKSRKTKFQLAFEELQMRVFEILKLKEICIALAKFLNRFK